MTYLGLYALQHRGQESAGMAVSDGEQIHVHTGLGWVNDVFKREILKKLPGHIAIGHVRYSTAGDTTKRNAQPFVAKMTWGELAIAHNGNIVNAGELRSELEHQGSIFTTTSDTEIILHLIARAPSIHPVEAFKYALQQVDGAVTLVMMTRNALIGYRDPYGFRPLWLAQIKPDTWVLASETTALDIIDAHPVRELQPGELVIISHDDLQRHIIRKKGVTKPRQCIFELVYFARPDSVIFGKSVSRARFRMGQFLARQDPVEADLVVPVPDSGVWAALGYADESGIPFAMGLIRNHYVGRTFIQPKDKERKFGVKIKLNPDRAVIQGKRIVLIDDSIVRGNTSRQIIQLLRHAGVKEVHMRISSPPIIGPCYYGIDTPTKKELIANRMSVEQIREKLGVDSLTYLSLENLLKSVDDPYDVRFCVACFTQIYPTSIESNNSTVQPLWEVETDSVSAEPV